MKKLLIVILLPWLFGACSNNNWDTGNATKINKLRTPPARIKVVAKELSRKAYLSTLENVNNVNSVRIVPVYSRAVELGGLPEYRLFDIRKTSPYYMLGIRNGDVLVACNDYIVKDPGIFRQYVQLLPYEKEAKFIEIRRAGRAMLLKYVFIQ